MLIEGTCTMGGGFLRRACGASPAGQCVYCGAPFCDRHGELAADYHEVCARPTCRAKFEDVALHRAWVEEHSTPNTYSICAEEQCTERMQHVCQRCQLRYCDAHLKPANVTEQRYDPPRRVVLMLCAHCVSRRKLWD